MQTGNRFCAGVLLASAALCPASASPTTAYTYDVHGRLVEASHAEGVADGTVTAYDYDPGDNRTQVATTDDGGFGALAAGLGGSSGETGNQAPVTSADYGGIARCSSGSDFDVTLDDRDPDGSGLELVGVSAGSLGTASVRNATSVWYVPGGTTGSETLTYTVEDSLGAQATGTLTILVDEEGCELS